MKLESLTKKQEKLLLEKKQEWINFSLYSGDELDIEAFKKGISWAYEKTKLSDPIKIYVDSPMGLQYACQILKKIDFSKVKNGQVSDQVRGQVSDQVYGQVRGQYESFAWMGLGWDSGWNSFYDYFEEIGIEVTDDYKKYREFIKSGVWDTILYNNFAIGCRRPNFVSRDEDNRMSNDQRSAISWRDGYEQFYLDGVFFRKELWEKIVSKTMTFQEIMAIEISDQRTVALKYNPEAIIKENAQLVHKDHRNNELYKIEGQKINKDLDFPKIWFLKMLCPTGRTFVEGVPPDEAEKNPNASYLQALLCDLTLDEYMSMTLES